MYVAVITEEGAVHRAWPDNAVPAGWRWRPAPRMMILAGHPAQLVTIEATDGPYGGPEYPAGGPR